MWPILQPRDQRKRLEALRIRQLQQPEGGEHIWSTQAIWTLDMARPRRRLPQSDRLHHGQATLPVKSGHRKVQELIGSDHELVMMTFRLSLQRMKNQGNIRIRFSLEKLKDPNIAEIFRATIGGKLAPLLVLENQDTEKHALINSFNTAARETTNNILGKHRPAKKPRVTDNILKLCDKRRELKQKNTTEGAKLYREANQQVQKGT